MKYMNFTGSGLPPLHLGNWISNPITGYHTTEGVTFGGYSPVMPKPIPPYGGYHPQAQFSKVMAPVGQDLYSLYGNPSSLYGQSIAGQR